MKTKIGNWYCWKSNEININPDMTFPTALIADVECVNNGRMNPFAPEQREIKLSREDLNTLNAMVQSDPDIEELRVLVWDKPPAKTKDEIKKDLESIGVDENGFPLNVKVS